MYTQAFDHMNPPLLGGRGSERGGCLGPGGDRRRAGRARRRALRQEQPAGGRGGLRHRGAARRRRLREGRAQLVRRSGFCAEQL